MNSLVSNSETLVLSELAAVLRAIARERRGAGRVLRELATAYEARARQASR